MHQEGREQPTEVIVPLQSTHDNATPSPSAPSPANELPDVAQPKSPSVIQLPQSADEVPGIPAGSGSPGPNPEQPSWYQPEAASSPQSTSAQPSVVEWSASEFIAQAKSPGWYLVFIIIAVVFAGIAYFATRDIALIIITVLIAAAVLFYAARSPRTLQYSIDSRGISIGSRFYPFSFFKSFSVEDEGPLGSIIFMPLQRFVPPISIHFSHDDGDSIMQALGTSLPLEDHKPDLLDRLVRRIRF